MSTDYRILKFDYISRFHLQFSSFMKHRSWACCIVPPFNGVLFNSASAYYIEAYCLGNQSLFLMYIFLCTLETFAHKMQVIRDIKLNFAENIMLYDGT